MIANVADVIRVDQVLHGYANGHQQLAQSRMLSRASERAMLSFSDMSGPAMARGFESYLTGYPLPADGFYALARTWYATEMPRPGCVWTHTLLVEYADLARIADLRSLLPFFTRPRTKIDIAQQYRDSIALYSPIAGERMTEDAGETLSRSFAHAVIDALYSTSGIPVFIGARDASMYQDMVLCLWTQQWPRLRRSFRFCTGALSDRSLEDTAFDLQVVPYMRVDEVRRGARNGVVISGNAIQSIPASKSSEMDWIAYVLDDLYMQGDTPLRHFLWRFASEAGVDRRVFRYLTQLYIHICDTRAGQVSPSTLVDEVASSLPHPHQAPRLKIALFGHPGQGVSLLAPDVPESIILRALVTTKTTDAFDANILKIRDRARALWHDQRAEAEALTVEIAAGQTAMLKVAFLEGVARALASAQARTSWQVREALLAIDLSVAFSPELWACPTSDKERILGKLGQRRIAKHDLCRITAALLAADAGDVAAEARSIFGVDVVRCILEAIDGDTRDATPMLSTGWRAMLSSCPREVLEWLQDAQSPHTRTIALVASLLDPSSSLVRSSDAAVWLRAADKARSELMGQPYVDFMVFLLVLGVTSDRWGHRALVVRAFQDVYDAIDNGTLGSRAWSTLERVIPARRSWWWERDDRADRLREAVLTKFIDNGWSADDFLACFRNPRALRQAMEDCNVTRKGRKFLRQVEAHARTP